ncbi:MAG: M23 family metallopeptidase [Pseudolysinimonas sp.]|uniref:M23 family metallopeptidase n=1 Tax=Pseudolysinimonas sp. TaxID=2680009 RepID=UPI0032669F27
MEGKGGIAAIAIMALPLLVVGGLIAMILLIFGPAQDAGACAPGRTVDPQKITETAIAGYNGVQLENAAHIMNAATDLRLDRGAQILGVLAAITESDLQVLDHGTDADPDRRGLFQQPDDPEWGSLSDRMDPTRSATNFYLQLQTVQSWSSLPPSVAVSRVQGGSDPYRFEDDYAAAALIVGTLAGGGEVVCQGGNLVFPLEAGFQMTSKFGYRGAVEGLNVNPFHAAVDLQNWPGACGAPVYAITAGTVTVKAGYTLSIKSPEGYTVSYLHMKLSDISVAIGDQVGAGDQVGLVGSEGPSTGCHLDLRMNVIGTTNQAVAELVRAESMGGPAGFVDPEEFYRLFGVELCPPDTCRRTY